MFPLIGVAGDVKGFGMVTAKTTACGTPTVAFRLGWVSDATCVANRRLVRSGDYEAFTAALIDIPRGGKPNAASCRQFAREFAWEFYHERLQDTLEPLLNKQAGNHS